jgi:hypothetical protein
MIEMLRGIVEERHILAETFLDDFLEGSAFQTAALNKIVGRGNIGMVMFVMVIFERLPGQIGLKRIIGIRKIGEGKRHRKLLNEKSKMAKPALLAIARPAAQRQRGSRKMQMHCLRMPPLLTAIPVFFAHQTFSRYLCGFNPTFKSEFKLRAD